MDLGLRGKRVLITGSTKGIGLATAKLFLEEGARVVLNGSSESSVKYAINELGGRSESLQAVVADVSSHDDIDEMFEFVDGVFGGIDVLINNAGIYRRSSLMALSNDGWNDIINADLSSVFWCSKRAFSSMQRRSVMDGVILNASSFAALLPSTGYGAYGAAKAAIINLTKTLAAELAPYNIRVNAYVPGTILTDMTSSDISQDREGLLSRIALRRFGSPDEVANVLAFLCSEKAAYITGSVVEVSGGKYAVQNPDAAWEGVNRMAVDYS